MKTNVPKVEYTVGEIKVKKYRPCKMNNHIKLCVSISDSICSLCEEPINRDELKLMMGRGYGADFHFACIEELCEVLKRFKEAPENALALKELMK